MEKYIEAHDNENRTAMKNSLTCAVSPMKRKTHLLNHALTRKSRTGSSPSMRKSISFTTTAPRFWTARWPKKRRAEEMTNFLRLDSENRRLIMDKTFAKNAQIVGSTEYDMTERSCCWMRPTALTARFSRCRSALRPCPFSWASSSVSGTISKAGAVHGRASSAALRLFA